MAHQSIKLIPRSTTPPIVLDADIRQQARLQRLAIRKAFIEKDYDAQFRLTDEEYNLTAWWLGILSGRYWTVRSIAFALEKPESSVRFAIGRALRRMNIPHSHGWGFAAGVF